MSPCLRGTETIKWEVEVKEKGTDELDRIRMTQRVVPVVPVSTFQATLAQIDKIFISLWNGRRMPFQAEGE